MSRSRPGRLGDSDQTRDRAVRSGDTVHWILVGVGIASLVAAAVSVVVSETTRSVGFRSGRALAPSQLRSWSLGLTPILASTQPRPSPYRSTLNLSGAPTGGVSTGRTAAAPTRIEIPAISLEAPVVQLGRNKDGSAMVPSGTTFTSWYDLGPIPGERGPAVIIGHVDSYTGPAVFFDLKYLLPGDMITVDDGTVPVSFLVKRVVVYPKDSFPTAEVFGPTPDAELRLVTCGGPFDRSIGHYEDNVVVYADAQPLRR